MSSTALNVTWKKLRKDDSNGVITNYEVCYQAGSTKPDCSTSRYVNDINNAVLTELKPARVYTVAIRAYTKIGSGPIGIQQSNKTDEASECFFLCVHVHKYFFLGKY